MIRRLTYRLRQRFAAWLYPEIWANNHALRLLADIDRENIHRQSRDLMRIRVLVSPQLGESELDAIKRLKKDLDLQAERVGRSIVIAPESDEYQPVRDFLFSRNFGISPVSGSFYKKGAGVTCASMRDGVITSDESDA